MFQDCIDLTFDDDEKRDRENDGQAQDTSFKPSRSLEVYECLSNSRTLDIIQSYRNNESFQLPTIISVQSLAQNNSSSKKIIASNTFQQPKKIKSKEKKSVFNKQKCQRPISSIASINESIEFCIINNVMYDDKPDENNESIPPTNTFKEVNTSTSLVNNEVNLLGIPSRTTDNDKSIPETPASCSSKTKPIDISVTAAVVSNNTMLFRKLLCKCVSLEENEKDRRRADQKLRSYHEKASLEYKESESFASLIEKQLANINKNNLYECLKIILDELKASRKIDDVAEPTNSENAADVEKLDAKTKAQVIKLSYCLEKLNKKIKKIEESEVDFDAEDDEDSAYIRLQRYRDRFIKIHKKICELTGKSSYAERISKKKIRFNLTKYPDVNKLIETWLNKNKKFPDFSDVIQVLSNANLSLKPDQLHNLAEEVFREIGKILQKRRKLELWDSLSAFESHDADPAASDSNLNEILINNRRTYQAKEDELIKMYAQKQHELKEVDDECSNDTAHKSDHEPEDCSNSDSSKQTIIDDNSMEAEENSLDKGDSDGIEIVENEPKDDIIEEIGFRPSSSRTPLTEIVVLGDEVKANTYEQSPSLKRRHSDDIKVIPKKRICPITIIDPPPQTDFNQNKNKKSTKPFGSVGQVIELNYLSVENFNTNVMSSIFKDRTNTINRRPKSFSLAIKEISDKYEKSTKCLKPLRQCYLNLTNSKIVYKSHGALGHGASSKENVSSNKENHSTTENQPKDKSTTNAGGISGSGGHGDDDKDQDKKNRIADETDLLDDEEATDDGDCEPDTTVDSGASVDNNADHTNYLNQDDSKNNSDPLLKDLECAEENNADDLGTDKKIENITDIEKIENKAKMSDGLEGDELNENSNDCSNNLNDESQTELQEPLPFEEDDDTLHIKVRDDLGETDLKNSCKESCEEKETEPDSQHSATSKKTNKPAWIDNGEESDNDSASAPNEPEKTIEASISCLSEKAVTSTSSLKTAKGKKKVKLIKKAINKRQKLDRKVKSSISDSSGIPINKSEEPVTKNSDLEMEKKIMASGVDIKKIEAQVEDDLNDDIEVISENIVKKPVLSGDERVKRFLESAKTSLAITVTRKRAMSQETMAAVSHLKRLKNVSATRVVRPSTSGNREGENSQPGPSRVHQQSFFSPTVRRTQPAYNPSPHQFSPRFTSTPSPLNRLMISNVRGSGNRINRSPNFRARLPVISSVQSFNPRSPVTMSARGNRGGAQVRFTSLRGMPQTRRPAISPASQGRGRGTGRGNRIVPVVVLD